MTLSNDFWLGYTFALLNIARAHMIEVSDSMGVALIENDYVMLEAHIKKLMGDDKHGG